MWKYICTETADYFHFSLYDNKLEASYYQALSCLESDEGFRSQFIGVLRNLPINAYKWETPAISESLLTRNFEFVVTEAPWLDRAADARDFSEHLSQRDEAVVSFSNLGGDAQLLVPTNQDPNTNYCHLGAFTQSAPEQQQQAFWQAVGRMGLELVTENPLWISTAGDGVPWLHLRFDQRPKYYVHKSYINPGDS